MALLHLTCAIWQSGRAEASFERNLKPWDFAAGIAILNEAGGKVTDFNGNEIDSSKKSDIVATNRKIHTQLLNIINK